MGDKYGMWFRSAPRVGSDSPPRLRWAVAGLAAALVSGGCEDKGKISAGFAQTHAQTTAALVERDVNEVRTALPLGAQKARSVLYAAGDPREDLGAVRKGLSRVQREVPELGVLKSTFFALIDAKGVAIRNNLETDAMGGRDLFSLFPKLATAKNGQLASTVGLFPESKLPTGDDPTWMAAAPVLQGEGDPAKPADTVLGYLATGWSFRRFAYHLEDTLRTEEMAKVIGKTGVKQPILYVGVFDRSHAYTAPQTPHVNEEAMEKLSPFEKTSAGPAHGSIELEGRSFGWAAERTPSLGEELGVVVLRSEV